ncbi:lipoprotein-releasing system ATP-binding protein LolD [Parachlamydia acanthamoebae UV-7]|uniref:Lipoprotein-releasing system ATP-binding protein LolD n=1 Tax=Parachlamydia acanthamoebae (strain UV7) TaxID=765952 RepID=F8L0L3_PARAV|nr:ABC transporter ATP-binding protein [Parachlamydia acanthamoebae]CCB86763.1 lipoprotein-releasing system ATP-binding protein LolD [Parachlamydia acanthamoebae UV-7]
MNQPLLSSVVLRATKLVKSFYAPVKVPILRGVDFQVMQGESVAIMGRSGEGKSTLLQILGTLEKPCSGSIEILDQEVTSANQTFMRNRHLAFIFQSFHLLEDYSVLDNVLMPARIGRQSVKKGSVAYQHACDLLDYVGLSHRLHFDTKRLSGGEKQRVAIARALCNNPDIILADEPSGNLDKQTSVVIHDLLLEFAKERGKALIVVTHDHSLANLCDKQYMLQNGYLVAIPSMTL